MRIVRLFMAEAIFDEEHFVSHFAAVEELCGVDARGAEGIEELGM